MFLQIEDVHKSFEQKPVLRGISLGIEAGEILVLLGPSGCGKTTLLRMIAGLESVENGRFLLNNQSINNTPIHKRGFGFVFQDYALFPHKNVYDNVAFGLRMQQWTQAKIKERVAQVLTLVGLAGFEQRTVHDLSGGEQQRVALARSLAPAPQLLLLDEPLGALDRALRERLMLDLRRILKEAGQLTGQPQGITAVYVTHDQAEAFAIADRVAVMNDGRLEQLGSPTELYRQPKTPFVARFLGMENLLEGHIMATEPLCVETAVGPLQVSDDRAVWKAGDPVTVLLRPESAQIISSHQSLPNQLVGQLVDRSFRGRYQIVSVAIDGVPTPLKFEWETAVTLPDLGDEVTMVLSPGSVQLMMG